MRRLALVLLLAVGMIPVARAQWPDRPVTIIVPWGAGGAADQLSRALAPLLEKDLKVPFNVVLRPGGSGAVGHTALAQSKPDGYTWGLATVEITMMHWQGLATIQPKDFTVVAIINADAGGLMVRTESPYKTARELIDDIKKRPAGALKASGRGRAASGTSDWSAGCWPRRSIRRKCRGCRARAPGRRCRTSPPAASTSSPRRCRRAAR
jgi:tripartite-type tricarboxylate transporter receptor subunit TctC